MGMDEQTAGLLQLASDPAGTPLPTVAALAYHPPLLGPFLGWAAALALEGVLTKRQHELVALRTAWRCDSTFEWQEHAGYALTAGLSQDEIERVKASPDAEAWGPGDRLVLQAADELHDSYTVAPATWAALLDQLGPAGTVEVLYVAGQYTMLSMVAKAIDA